MTTITHRSGYTPKAGTIPHQVLAMLAEGPQLDIDLISRIGNPRVYPSTLEIVMRCAQECCQIEIQPCQRPNGDRGLRYSLAKAATEPEVAPVSIDRLAHRAADIAADPALQFAPGQFARAISSYEAGRQISPRLSIRTLQQSYLSRIGADGRAVRP